MKGLGLSACKTAAEKADKNMKKRKVWRRADACRSCCQYYLGFLYGVAEFRGTLLWVL